MLNISKHFEIHELVPRELFISISEEVLWRMVPSELSDTIDAIKDRFPEGAMTINNYAWGGDRNWSGLRTDESPYYSSTSQHTLFNAIDAVFSDYDTDTVRQYILDNPEEFPHIGGIELGVSWLHADIRPRYGDKIRTFDA